MRFPLQQCTAGNDEGPVRQLRGAEDDRRGRARPAQDADAQDPAAPELAAQVHVRQAHHRQAGEVLCEERDARPGPDRTTHRQPRAPLSALSIHRPTMKRTRRTPCCICYQIVITGLRNHPLELANNKTLKKKTISILKASIQKNYKAKQGTMMPTFGDFIPVSSPTDDQFRNKPQAPVLKVAVFSFLCKSSTSGHRCIYIFCNQDYSVGELFFYSSV
jgi:hypothetical protein